MSWLSLAVLVLFLLPARGELPDRPVADLIETEDFSRLTPENCRPFRFSRFVFVPDSLSYEHEGCIQIEAEGPERHRRIVSFEKGETEEGLDRAEPIVVEGYLMLIRHKARDEFHAVVELQVRGARRVR